MSPVRFDEIGYWSELKLEIVKKYAAAYSRILANQPRLSHVYVDAFAGPGQHLSRRHEAMVPGSPLNALQIVPPFHEYHLIDMDRDKVQALRDLVGPRDDVFFYEGDCNTILLREVLPRLTYASFRRGLVLLDPYGLDLQWEVMRTAGQLRTVDLFLNFPLMDMHRNVLWTNPDRVDAGDIARMTTFWGDDTWRQAAYVSVPTLFGDELQKTRPDTVVEAFCVRLRTVAGFKHVAPPLPMRNSSNSIVYYLIFASQYATADHIINDIFTRFRQRGS